MLNKPVKDICIQASIVVIYSERLCQPCPALSTDQ